MVNWSCSLDIVMILRSNWDDNKLHMIGTGKLLKMFRTVSVVVISVKTTSSVFRPDPSEKNKRK